MRTLGLEDVVADDVALEPLEQLTQLLLGADVVGIGEHLLDGGLLDSSHLLDPALLDLLAVSLAQRRLERRLELAVECLVVALGELPGLLGAGHGKLDDQVDHRLEGPVAVHHGIEHGLLGQLLGLGFDHHHGVTGAGDDEVEGAGLELLDGRVDHELAVDMADPAGADGPEERQAADRQRRARRDHRQHVRIVLAVMGEDGGDDLRLVLEGAGKERPDRPVDQPRGQGLLLGGPALALEEAARDLAGGERLLLVVHGHREEILARLDRLGADGGGQHHRLAQLRQHGAIGLPRDAAGLEAQRAAEPLHLFDCRLEHSPKPFCGLQRQAAGPPPERTGSTPSEARRGALNVSLAASINDAGRAVR